MAQISKSKMEEMYEKMLLTRYVPISCCPELEKDVMSTMENTR